MLGTSCCIRLMVREWTEQDLQDTFVAALTHDLRTPLTAAKMGVQLLARRHADLPTVQSSVNRVSGSLDRAERMSQNLLDASRIQMGKEVALELGECDLHAVTSRTLDELRRAGHLLHHHPPARYGVGAAALGLRLASVSGQPVQERDERFWP